MTKAKAKATKEAINDEIEKEEEIVDSNGVVEKKITYKNGNVEIVS